jgi:fimbrial chaperone protein
MRGVALGALAVLLSVAAGTASAASLHVSPTRVVVTDVRKAGTMTLRNDGTGRASFRATLHHWANDAAGNLALTPTTDLVVYPALFTIEPGAIRLLRIGTNLASAPNELAYRLVIEEMPSNAARPAAAGVAMLTRLNMPVFVQPSSRQLKATLERPTVSGGVATIALANDGSVHVTPTRYTLTALAADKTLRWRRDLRIWYVLRGERQEQRVPLDAAACRGIASLVAEVELEELPGRPLREQVAATTCSP